MKYEPTGSLELQLRRKQTGFAEVTWIDSKRTKLEEQLNNVMVELIVAVDKERSWRRQQHENEKQRRADEAKRWQQEQERRKEEQKINELNQKMQNWYQADRIRAFMDDVRARVQRTRGPIDNGSDLDRWITWALKHADRIDPLGPREVEHPIPPPNDNWSPPGNPK